MIPDEALINILDNMIQIGTVKMFLVKSNPSSADKDMTLSELAGDEADYPGYSSGGLTVTWGSRTIVSPDDAIATSTTCHFQPSGMSTPQTIYGYWITFPHFGVGDKLWMWKRFDTPLVLASDASTIDIVVSIYTKDFSPP